jgi:hypothetical protein
MSITGRGQGKHPQGAMRTLERSGEQGDGGQEVEFNDQCGRAFVDIRGWTGRPGQ